MEAGTLNNLNDVHQLHCGGELAKGLRDVFVEGTIQDIRSQFQVILIDTCAWVKKGSNVIFRFGSQ